MTLYMGNHFFIPERLVFLHISKCLFTAAGELKFETLEEWEMCTWLEMMMLLVVAVVKAVSFKKVTETEVKKWERWAGSSELMSSIKSYKFSARIFKKFIIFLLMGVEGSSYS